MTKSFFILLSLFAFVMLGCNARHTSLEEGKSKSAIYQMNETEMFNLVYSSIQETFPQEKISVITEPTRGYITKFLAPPFHVDWFTQKVLIHRSSGIDKSGKKVYGYWIDVSGSGSSFLQGQLKNKELFSTILSHLESSAQKYVVSNISKAPYLVPQENFYVRGADTLEGKGERVIITVKQDKNDDNKSKAVQLRELHQLKVDNIITNEEYKQAKQNILNKY
jgi:hypothetical protein